MTNGRQTGIALITVLLVLSLATVAAVAMTSRQQLDIRRTTNVLRIEEAHMALLAAEEFTKALLLFDLTQTKTPNNTDGFGDYWASPLLKSAVQTVGNFTVTNLNIEDLQGRFNINNLLNDTDKNNYNNFTRLLTEVGLNPNLADVALDWVDADTTESNNNGAEDTAYQSLNKPYIPPNREMASASEIYRLMGLNLPKAEDYNKDNYNKRKLIRQLLHGPDNKVSNPSSAGGVNNGNSPVNPNILPVLIALPQGTAINVNTPSSPAIFQMIVPGLSLDDAIALFNLTRVAPEHAPPFAGINDFWNHDLVKKHNVAPNRRVPISVDSHYFLLHAEAIQDDLVVYSNTIFYRSSGPPSVRVVHRSYGKSGEI